MGFGVVGSSGSAEIELFWFGIFFFNFLIFELGTVLTLYLVNSMRAAGLVCCSFFLFSLVCLIYFTCHMGFCMIQLQPLTYGLLSQNW